MAFICLVVPQLPLQLLNSEVTVNYISVARRELGGELFPNEGESAA
jgi:hypothetical protein